MAATLRLEIVTPETRAYSEDVEMVVLPGVEGEMGILPMHVPLMTQIKPGELVVTKGGQRHHLAVGEGFVEITQERVSVLTDMAIDERQIDESAAEAAVKRAEEALKGTELGGEEAAAVQAALAKSLAQLHVKRRRRNI
ncbi:MAG TPA: F0F1 ATP synthase subunit epsilon [Chthoniobacteraceae bacterium]|jgi:F-type H+-transporting ATPase subunit epsilon